MPVQATAPRTVLRDVIDARGIRYSFIASKLSISPGHLTRLLNRERALTEDLAIGFEDLLQIDRNEFLDGLDLLVSKSVDGQAQVPPASLDEGRDGDK